MPETKPGPCRIDYFDAGHGEPGLLFMPGWCATRAAYGAMLEICSRKRRTLALDWRGHGRSSIPPADFGTEGLIEDALGVIAASGLRSVIPVALAHSGWIALELCRRIPDRGPKLVLLEWIVLDPPAPFLAALNSLQQLNSWKETRDRLFAQWLEGVHSPEVVNFVRDVMGSFEFDMWSRAGREIAAAYARYKNPLQALKGISPPPTLHLYAQPSDPAYWQAQRDFAEAHPWFQVERVNACSHFPMLEVPEEISAAIERFAAT